MLTATQKKRELLAWLFLAALLLIPAASAQTIDVDALLAREKDPAALSDAAQNLVVTKQFAQAERLWQRAVEISPGYFPALFNLGYLYFSSQQFDKSVGLLERAAKTSPEDFNTHYLMGTAFQKLDKRDQALRAWRKALAIQPMNQRLMQVMAVEYGKGRYFQEAAELAGRVMATGNDAGLYFIAIKAYQDAGNYEEAMKLARQAVQKFPDSARANFEYAFHLQKSGRFEDCLPYLKKATELDPKYEEPFFFYGDVLVRQGRYEEAIAQLQRAIENQPDYVAARVALGRALIGQKKWNEAITVLEEAARRQPDHPQPHLLLSQVYFRLRDEDKARKEKVLSLRLRRENPTLLESVQGRPFPD